MPRKTPTTVPIKAVRTPRAAAKAPAKTAVKPVAAAKAAARTSAKPPVKPAAKSAAKRAAKPAAKPAAKAVAKTAASENGGRKAAVKAAARALITQAVKPPAPAKRAVRKASAAAPERTPVLDARPSLVRDSFTMPQEEYAVLAEVKGACLRAGVDVKKSELLRIGVALLGQLDMTTLQAVLAALPQLKTGRPPAQS